MIQFVKSKKNYLQTFVEQCKYKDKETVSFINKAIENPFSKNKDDGDGDGGSEKEEILE